MKILTSFFALFIFFIYLVAFESLAEPPVLKCEKDCGTLDINDDFTFQARMAQGSDMWGANVTFIEDDIILSSAHILGFEPNKRKTLSCGAEAATKKNTDWHHHKKNMYVVDGKNYPKEKIIIAKVLDISARATGVPPGYDIIVAHVDRNCKKCTKGQNIKTVSYTHLTLPTNREV